MGPVRHLLLLALLLLGACTVRGAVDRFTSPEDRAFALEMVSRLRSGDQAWLRQHFDPELWERSSGQLAGVPALFPAEAGTTEIVGFETSTGIANGRTRRSKEFILATRSGNRWMMTSFRTFSTGGPDRVVQWNVVPHDSRPPELAWIEAWDSAVPWIWAGMAAGLLGMGALVFWLVRRSRRRQDRP